MYRKLLNFSVHMYNWWVCLEPREELIEEEEEIIQDKEEIVEDEEEVVKEDQEEELEEEAIKSRPKAKSLIEVLLSLYNLYNKEDKQLKILLILYRTDKGLHVNKFKELLRTNGKYVKRYLNELEEFGLVQSYHISPDPRTYYKLTEKGKLLTKLILNLINFG
ncbi:hypothetical protein [Sulfolobus spindle-shaped virus]|nr:hypothetical protein [Sulfolobus spindle-shaped virus]AZG03212.1 hypothetical protein [Sulfolobus spindle-shaped virus]AZG03330.1 hypothetical protein [Sulfolobus spindle-shaped virus]AZG03497.1 hypothetical protein [Sulfolobus spindle-shaped virus]